MPDPSRSIAEGAIEPWGPRAQSYQWQMIETLAQHYDIDLNAPFQSLSAAHQELLLQGTGSQELVFKVEHDGMSHKFRRAFEGVIPQLERRYRETGSDMIRGDIDRYVSYRPCDACHGKRLRPEALSVLVGGRLDSRLYQPERTRSAPLS